MVNKLIDMLIDEKMGCKEYDELADMVEEEDVREMFKMISEQEHNHYKMIKEYLNKYIKDDE